MAKSENKVDSLRSEVDKLREQVAKEEAKASESARKADDDIVVAQLEAEKARLQAQLAQAKAVSTPQESAPLNAVREQMELAVAQQRAAEELNKTDKEA